MKFIQTNPWYNLWHNYVMGHYSCTSLKAWLQKVLLWLRWNQGKLKRVDFLTWRNRLRMQYDVNECKDYQKRGNDKFQSSYYFYIVLVVVTDRFWCRINRNWYNYPSHLEKLLRRQRNEGLLMSFCHYLFTSCVVVSQFCITEYCKVKSTKQTS